jgi:CIC family chloride channel protein
MLSRLPAVGSRIRLLVEKLLAPFGSADEGFLIVLAFLIGIVTAAAAVGFHELITIIRDLLYKHVGAEFLYGSGVWMLIAIPALGGLTVGLLSRFVMHEREGHGITDVLESVMRSGGVIRPASAIEKILTSAVTIGSGGSAGAEGPIVQIGAAIASGIGQFFRVARPHLPVLIGCGCAAGISAIFNSPIGGLLFTLEVILRDFSIRTLTPLVIASVIANVTTRTIYRALLHQDFRSIFNMPQETSIIAQGGYTLWQVGNFLLLGIVCAVMGVVLIRMMQYTEKVFGRIKAPRWSKPAIGGMLLGVIGVTYVLVFRVVMGRAKFIPFEQYAMPAFFGDGYGAVQSMLGPAFYLQMSWGLMLGVLGFLLLAKLVGTCLTLASGGAGGIIAPSLFVGAVAGGALGMVLQRAGLSSTLPPNSYALIGMGAVLAAVVHAPLAAVLILMDVTRDYQVIVPAMLASVTATAIARLISTDSIYTLSLRMRGIQVGTAGDLLTLRRMSLEQVVLDPAIVVHADDPMQRLLDLTVDRNIADFVVSDRQGQYLGMVVGDDVKRALIDREAVPLLLVEEIMRSDLPIVRNTDDLATVMAMFSAHDVSRLPVGLPGNRFRVIGLVSRAALMRQYQQALAKG